jgi:hypothetical protein
MRRVILLVLGPLPIVACSYGLSHWLRTEVQAPQSNRVVPSAGALAAGPEAVEWASADRAGSRELSSAASRPATRNEAFSDSRLQADCQAAARRLSKRLDDACRTIARTPFVIAGDLTEAELNRWHERTIGPAARAMGHRYFTARPDQPITVLLFSGEDSYNRYAKALYGDEGVSVYGYYKPHLRTLVMNIGTGGGTLVHELTHALVDFDFPEVPDWFNEGLASLHEQCRIRPDETGIDGLVNWRLAGLKQAIRRGRLASLETLLSNDDFRGADVGLNYAQARYFCMFMQSGDNPRGEDVLAEFYRLLRLEHREDPTGASAVRQVFAQQDWAELDRRFQSWVLSLSLEE